MPPAPEGTSRPRLCLNMIVRDEAPIIERCLASVVPIIDCWSITDTGSTDGTPDIIRSFFKERGIAGWLHRGAFENFSQARNDALERANRDADWDGWFLLADADMELVVENDNFARALDGAVFGRLMQRMGALEYWNTRLLKRGAKARYVGATHEYLDVEGDQCDLRGAWFIDHACGSSRAGKFERDVRLLTRELEQDPQNGRSWFYLGQSLKDLGKPREAADAYAQRVKLGGWPEETWRAKLEQARCLRNAGDDNGFVANALLAYDMRPHRAEPLYDLAQYYRDKGKNELAVMFAERGMAISYPHQDALFIESAVYSELLKSEFSIAAFYDPKTNPQGREVCDELALSRDVSRETRDQARRNLWFYARKLDQIAPSFTAKRIDWTPPEGWRAMNPSIARIGDKLMCVIRTVNYQISPEGRYIMPEGEMAIRTRNWLAELGDDLRVERAREIERPLEWANVIWPEVIGLEDVRLFDAGAPWFSATVRERNSEGRCEQVLGCVSMYGHTDIMRTMMAIQHHEKNWMPIGKSGRFLYSCDPTRVVDDYGCPDLSEDGTDKTCDAPIAAENFRGGSQLIPLDGGWLALIHEVPEFHRYVHRFVWFDAEFRLSKVSHQFRFLAEHGIEFCAGMAWLDDERLVISFGVGDAEAWLGTVTANEVRTILRELPRSGTSVVETLNATSSDRRDRLATGNGDGSRGNRPNKARTLPASKASFLKEAGAWADAQTNRALLTSRDVDWACGLLAEHKLPLHPDRPKNWDTVIGLVHALRHTKSNERILDAGAGRESAFLPALARLKYRHLDGVNLLFDQPLRVAGVHYGPGDITKLDYPDETFAFVFCQSVIEHDVDTAKFFKEMARILKPGGRLLVSTDYWDGAVSNPANKIYRQQGMIDLLEEAADVGLFATGDVSRKCQDRVVTHCGASYTFLNLLFRKTA